MHVVEAAENVKIISAMEMNSCDYYRIRQRKDWL
jgi:hypothetical protein